jgi:hypothetical protein
MGDSHGLDGRLIEFGESRSVSKHPISARTPMRIETAHQACAWLAQSAPRMSVATAMARLSLKDAQEPVQHPV